jgi:hypothetical protein
MLDDVFIGWAAHDHARRTEGELAGQRAARVADDTRSRLEAMQVDIDRLLMISEALWTILKEQHGYTEEDLLKRISEIDLRDGRLDGKVERQGPVQCPRCGRNNKSNRPACLYCATPLNREMFKR